MPDSERALLLRILEESYARKGWHGATLRGALRGLVANQAFWRPAVGRHNIWDFVLHCAYWKYSVARRLSGVRRGSFPREGSNWFRIPEPTDRAWKEDLALLDSTHQSLREAVESVSIATLKAKARQVYGVAAHDAYHAGQIQILKRMYGL